MLGKNKDESTIAAILKEVIANSKLQEGINQVEVRNLWHEVLGNGVSAYTSQIVLKGGTLYVDLTSSVLREELHYGKQKIIAILNEALGRVVIQEIILR